MAVEPALTQLPPETVLKGGRPIAAVALSRGALNARTPLEWHRGEDDLGPYDAAVVTTDHGVRWALVAYSEVAEQGLIVVGDDVVTEDDFHDLLSALHIKHEEVDHVRLSTSPSGHESAAATLPRARTSRKRTARRAKDVKRAAQAVPASITKSEFVDMVASESGLSKKDSGAAVDAVLATIQSALENGEDVSFAGFGRFHVVESGVRESRNPRTGETMIIAAAKVPRFTAGSGLKKAVK